jgi:hypothetical protein
MLNAMVRMTVKFCLFTLSFVLSFTLTGNAEGFPANHALPIYLNDLIEIHESMDTAPSDRWEVIGQSNCQLFSGLLNLPPDQPQPTCPFESMASANGSALSTKPVWSAIGEFAAARKRQLNTAIERSSQTACEIHATIKSAAAVQFRSFAANLLPQRPLGSARQLVPAMLSSYGGASGNAQESSSAPAQSLIVFTGDQQDPYWQYYDDCDRWSVEFTTLLNEARSTSSSVCSLDEPEGETIIELKEATDLDFDFPTSRFSITRFLISRNVSNWLETSQFEKQVSNSLLDWLRVAEFNSVVH